MLNHYPVENIAVNTKREKTIKDNRDWADPHPSAKCEGPPHDTRGVGAGGSRIWDIKTTATGEQKINAAYMQSWEPVTGNETGFLLTVRVS